MKTIKEQLEIFEDIQYRMADGIEHAFFDFDWKEIDIPEFHQKRQNFLKAVAELKAYVNFKCKDLNRLKSFKESGI